MSEADDVTKKVGSFFTKLGGQLKEVGKTVGAQVVETGKVVGAQVAATSKQVTGLGRGEVKLELPQTRYAPGEAIKGKFTLALRDAVAAKRAVVSLRARQRFVSVKNRDRGVGATTHAEVYQFDLEVAPSGTFEAQSFDFELTVPPDALSLRPKESASANPLVDVARTIASAVTPNAGPIEWEVLGRLEISWGRDLSHEMDIVVAGPT